MCSEQRQSREVRKLDRIINGFGHFRDSAKIYIFYFVKGYFEIKKNAPYL